MVGKRGELQSGEEREKYLQLQTENKNLQKKISLFIKQKQKQQNEGENQTDLVISSLKKLLLKMFQNWISKKSNTRERAMLFQVLRLDSEEEKTFRT